MKSLFSVCPFFLLLLLSCNNVDKDNSKTTTTEDITINRSDLSILDVEDNYKIIDSLKNISNIINIDKIYEYDRYIIDEKNSIIYEKTNNQYEVLFQARWGRGPNEVLKTTRIKKINDYFYLLGVTKLLKINLHGEVVRQIDAGLGIVDFEIIDNNYFFYYCNQKTNSSDHNIKVYDESMNIVSTDFSFDEKMYSLTLYAEYFYGIEKHLFTPYLDEYIYELNENEFIRKYKIVDLKNKELSNAIDNSMHYNNKMKFIMKELSKFYRIKVNFANTDNYLSFNYSNNNNILFVLYDKVNKETNTYNGVNYKGKKALIFWAADNNIAYLKNLDNGNIYMIKG